MSSDVTDITIILDRSGSMNSIRQSVVDGINQLIEDTQKVSGQGYWSLIQFDDPSSAKGAGEEFPQVVFENVPDSEVRKLGPNDFMPRGGTALVDAVCTTLLKIKKALDDTPEEKRPRVMVVIMTDGEENQSREFNNDKLRELSAEMQAKYSVTFMYLGANVDVFHNTQKYGMNQAAQFASYGSGGGFTLNVAAGVSNALPMTPTAAGVMECIGSGSIGVRAWKSDGNPTAMGLLSNALPDATNASIACSGVDVRNLQSSVDLAKFDNLDLLTK